MVVLLVMVVEEERGLGAFWDPRSRVVRGGEMTDLFSVWISLCWEENSKTEKEKEKSPKGN